ncbi:ubiquitin carboxyl-terminal hydrolase 5/13 [Sarotherodon galilaeus]
MDSLSLLVLCLFYLTQAASGHHPAVNSLLMVAVEGDNVTLPCGIPSIKTCSSISWDMSAEFNLTDEIINGEKPTAPNSHRYRLLKDCSLQITQLVLNDARLYTCKSGTLKSSVSLRILCITEKSLPANDKKMELHCYLSTEKGVDPCFNHKELHIKWSTEDDTPINGSRFAIKHPYNCFSKLIIEKKLTDHHRKWRCHLTQNGLVKATISYTTTVEDGLEEVFATVGESVLLTCGNTSSPDMKWTLREKQLRDASSPDNGQIKASHVNQDSSLVISRLSSLHAGDYQCSHSTDKKDVLNKFRLHTLDVTAMPAGLRGENLTLTCALTCATECEKDFELTWSGSAHKGWQSELMNINNTLIKKLFLPESSVRSYEDITCSVHREGALVASKKWHAVDPLQTPAWVALPLVILIVAGGLYIYKRKRNKDPANDQPSTEMTHVYEVVQDDRNEEQQQQLQSKREAATATTTFYDLLQAVN